VKKLEGGVWPHRHGSIIFTVNLQVQSGSERSHTSGGRTFKRNKARKRWRSSLITEQRERENGHECKIQKSTSSEHTRQVTMLGIEHFGFTLELLRSVYLKVKINTSNANQIEKKQIKKKRVKIERQHGDSVGTMSYKSKRNRGRDVER